VEAQEVGSGREDLPAQISGEDLDIAFNVRYLLDGLKAFDTQSVQMQCNTATSPAVLIPLGDTKITYLVMPVQIRA
jgi:DNA polymerase-3 subunit beta